MLSEQVKKLRKQKGWIREKLAVETNISYGTVVKIERNLICNPTKNTLIKLAEIFGITIDKLIGRKK